jgi:hypothetical protein
MTPSRTVRSRAYAEGRSLPIAKAEEAYRRMMNNEARFRLVLVTGQ